MKTFKRNYKWEIETSSGKHTIELHLGGNSREPIDIILDGKNIDRIVYHGLSLIPNMEHDIKCDGEIIKMVLYGSTVDIIHNGKFVTSGIECNENNKLPIVYRIGVTILSLASLSVLFWYKGLVSGNLANILAIAMGIFCSVLTYSNSTAPFYPKKKRILLSLCTAVLAWVLAFLVMVILGNSGFSLSN